MGILAISALSASAGEVYYRWVDERGDPVHSDRPPPKGVDYEVVSTQSSAVRPVTAKEGAVPREVAPRVGNEFETADSGQPRIEKNPEFCQRAQDNLGRLETDARIRMRNDQGEVYYLEPDERAEERQKAIDAIETYCE